MSPVPRFNLPKWIILATVTDPTLAEIQELAKEYKVAPDKLELGTRWEDENIEVGYWEQPTEKEQMVREAEWRAAIRLQNEEYTRLGLL